MPLPRQVYGQVLYGEAGYNRLDIPIVWVFEYPIGYGYINEAIITWDIVTSTETTVPVVQVSLDQTNWETVTSGSAIPQLNEQNINTACTLYVKVSVTTTDTNNPIDIRTMDVYLDYTEFQHYAICSDGRKFIDGKPVDSSTDLSFVSFNPATSILTLSGPRIYDEFYITPRIVTDEEVALWKAIGAPFYDANSPVDVAIRPIMHNNGVLNASGHEIYALVQGEQKLVARFGVNASGDVGLAIYNNAGEEVAFTGRRQDGTIITDTEGVNADTLDGLHASAFALATQLPETGSNAKGTWRKWADGTLECWGTKTFTSVAVTTLWGGGIYISPTQTVTWPISFAEIESANINVIARTPENFIPALIAEAASSFYGRFYFWGPASCTYNSITVGFYAKGKWK